MLALARRLRAVRRERRRVGGIGDACGRSCRSPSASAGCSRASPAARPARLEIDYEGEIADYDCRVLTLSVLKGVLGAGRRRAGVVRERAAARGGARHRRARDEVVGRARLREPDRRARRRGHARAPRTLFGKQQAPRIVGIDEHTVDLPPARHMLVVHNDDMPGMIGSVGTMLGDAGVNISDMDVGREPERRGRARW